MSLNRIPFAITTGGGDGYNVVSLTGEFDLSVKSTVDEALSRRMAPDAGALIIDLGGLTFLDSSGIHSLVMAHRDCAAQGQPLVVIRAGSPVMRILTLCGLESRLTLVDDLAQALSGLSGGPADKSDLGGPARAVA
jgi:anti-anti-sigma factor